MNTNDIIKRNGKATDLKVFQVTGDQYFVEASSGKVCYKVLYNDLNKSCVCPDYMNGINQNLNFICKHILAVSQANGNSVKIKALQNGKPKLDDRFISNIKGKDFVLYAGLLDLAHQIGINSVTVECIKFPSNENGNEAICRAIIESTNGQVFTELGDANPKNVNSLIREHILRMASTRAKARCFRDMTNIGLTALEELGDISDVVPTPTKTTKNKPKPVKPAATKGRVKNDKSNNSEYPF